LITLPEIALPDLLLAQGGTGSPPAGGGSTGQVIGGTVAAILITGAMFAVVLAHRSGRTRILDRLGTFAERQTGLPSWASLPLAILGGSLIIAVFGMYWDIATHIDAGRDEGPFANASHYFILAGLFGIFFAGLVGIFLAKERPGRAAVRIPNVGYAPLGAVLIMVCAAFALSGFPLDDMWHRAFGQDVTLWGPTHLLLFGGASLTTLAALVLLVEGVQERRVVGPDARDMSRLLGALLGGSFLIGLCTFQGEFDYAVPQFRLEFHPILLALSASVGLVTARVFSGRGGALAAVGLFLLIRGLLTVIVSPGFGHTTLHFPLFIVEAVLVELIALRIPRERPITFGAVAGAAIGTIGLAAEWGWSYLWWTIEWPDNLLPEAAIAALITAIGGGIVGGFIGRALISPTVAPQPVPRILLPAALIAVVGVIVYATPISEGDEVIGRVTLSQESPPPQREVHATVRLDPADAADDARWFVTTAWQGNEGRSVVDKMSKVSPGVWRTTKPVPVYSNWKASIRLHKDNAIQGVPVYFPPDPAIPVEGIPARDTFTRLFQVDKQLLQREQKPGVSGALVAFGYITVLIIGLGLYSSMGWGLALLQRRLSVPTGQARA
jgi:hypothetical protein